MRRILCVITLLVLGGCSTQGVCPVEDDSKACKCWRREMPWTECRKDVDRAR